MSFLDIVSKFNQKADSHSKSQSLNPFSEQFESSRSPSPRFSREEYGKPIAGSKTDLRGRKAKSHICREILELCTVIHDVGTYNAKKKEPDGDDSEDDGTIIVSFGELFQIYTKISDKVVGLLIAAKRRGFVYFDREILFQRRDDDVLIALLKPISEISKVLKDDINQTTTSSDAPAAEVAPKPVEKKKSTKRTKPAVHKDSEEEAAVTFDRSVDVVSTAVEEIANIPTTSCVGEAVQYGETNVDNNYCNGGLVANGLTDDEIVVNNVVEISENPADALVVLVGSSCENDDDGIDTERDGPDEMIENTIRDICDLVTTDLESTDQVLEQVENVDNWVENCESSASNNYSDDDDPEVLPTESSVERVVDHCEYENENANDEVIERIHPVVIDV